MLFLAFIDNVAWDAKMLEKRNLSSGNQAKFCISSILRKYKKLGIDLQWHKELSITYILFIVPDRTEALMNILRNIQGGEICTYYVFHSQSASWEIFISGTVSQLFAKEFLLSYDGCGTFPEHTQDTKPAIYMIRRR